MCTEPPEQPPDELDMPPLKRKVSEKISQIGALISDHIESKHSALRKHETALQAEAVKRAKGSKAVHGRIRHGYQTGWTGQLVRIVTKRPPDQGHDPMGVAPVTKTWTQVGESKGTQVSLGKKGQAVPGATPFKATKFAKSGGQSAGVFYNPAAQNHAVDDCLAKVPNIIRYTHCEVRTNLGKRIWLPFSFCYVHINDRPGGYGVAFENIGERVDRKAEDVCEAVEDYLSWATWADFWSRSPGATPPGATTGGVYRFPKWGDVLTYLGVTQITRNGARAEIGLNRKTGKELLMTCFPVTVDEFDDGWAPGGYKLADEDGTSAEWTGGLKTAAGTAEYALVPSWANER